MVLMIDRLDRAIRAGVIGGIVLAVLAMLSSFSFAGLGCILGLLGILAAAGTGALAASFGRRHVGGLVEAVVLSGLAGAIAGGIDGVVQVILSFIRPGFTSGGILGFLGNEFMALVWAPFTVILYVVIIAFIAMVGGAIYGVLTANLD